MNLELFKGDITTLEVDAIVNAANPTLGPGHGVCGAIHAAAGPELAVECDDRFGCETGQATVTKGYDLPADYVIHTIGPDLRRFKPVTGVLGQNMLLRNAYQSSLSLAWAIGCESIAIPAISTGVYAFPPDQAAAVAVRTCLRAERKPERIVLCAFDDENYDALAKAMTDEDVPVTEYAVTIG